MEENKYDSQILMRMGSDQMKLKEDLEIESDFNNLKKIQDDDIFNLVVNETALSEKAANSKNEQLHQLYNKKKSSKR